MQILRKILWGLLFLALLYGALLVAERVTTQELTHVTNESSQETLCLMWQPRLLRGDGRCYLSLVDAQGKVTDTAELAILSAGLEALQQFGQLGFQGRDITVTNMKTGELVRRLVVDDGRLNEP